MSVTKREGDFRIRLPPNTQVHTMDCSPDAIHSFAENISRALLFPVVVGCCTYGLVRTFVTPQFNFTYRLDNSRFGPIISTAIGAFVWVKTSVYMFSKALSNSAVCDEK